MPDKPYLTGPDFAGISQTYQTSLLGKPTILVGKLDFEYSLSTEGGQVYQFIRFKRIPPLLFSSKIVRRNLLPEVDLRYFSLILATCPVSQFSE